jgi:acetolactate synthase-1/2/3 large subunit
MRKSTITAEIATLTSMPIPNHMMNSGAGARIVVIVFNDGALSLIELKKGRRALPPDSVGWAHPGFAEAARGLGCAGFTVATVAEYRAALDAALTSPGPAVIDVRIDAAGYPDQLRAARG